MNGPKRRVHFVGIGGIGMSGIAEVLLTLGYRVSGTDLVESQATRRLRDLGAQVEVGPHDAANVDPATDVLVISSAVAFANPEVARARALRIPVIPRAEMLAELMRLQFGIAVAGTHGKTTTTSLIGSVLHEAGRDPTVVVGGRLRGPGTNARIGTGRVMVAEADESDGTFLLLSPIIAVVTNVDPEHLEHFGDIENVRDAYRRFVSRVPFYGLAVLCIDNVNVRAMLPQVNKRFVTYGTSPDAEWQARDLSFEGPQTTFTLWRNDTLLGTVRLPMPGRHNALNALAAFAVAAELGIPWRITAHAIAEFGGVHRRFEIRGEEQGVLVVDDYAHHPQEIRATLQAARDAYGRRIVVVFQPHRYTRTRDLFTEFLGAFDDASTLVVTDVYPAGEDPIEGATAEALYQALKRRGHLDVHHVADRAAVAERMLDVLQPGDLMLTVGAGDVYRTADEVLALLRSGRSLGPLH